MASLKKHISFGVLWAIIISVVAVVSGMLNLLQAVIVFTLAVIGSGLPDIDSDTSKPVQILFGIIGVVCPVVMYKLFLGENATMESIFLCILGLYLVIQHLLSKIFMKYTKHRGIYHSIPAAIISGEIVFLIFASSELATRLFFASAVTGGYLSHLILDEIYSVDLMGLKIKSSLGSALAFTAPSKIVTLLAYLLLIILGILCVFI